METKTTLKQTTRQCRCGNAVTVWFGQKIDALRQFACVDCQIAKAAELEARESSLLPEVLDVENPTPELELPEQTLVLTSEQMEPSQGELF